MKLLSSAGDNNAGVENQVLIPVPGPLTFPSVHPKAHGSATLPPVELTHALSQNTSYAGSYIVNIG